MKKENKKNNKDILNDLKNNSSFVFLITIIGILLIFIIKIYFKKEINESFFYVIHTIHVFVFGIIISALFFKHRKNPFIAFLIGFIASVMLASISDIIFPFIGALIFNLNTSFNLPIVKTPFIIISTGLIGSLIGIETKFEKIPLWIQVFISVFTGLFYLISFSKIPEFFGFIHLTIIVFLGALITNCIRDLAFPYFFSK